MTWNERRRRDAALEAVLGYAAAYPDADLPLRAMPGLLTLFGSRRRLVCALQERWANALRASTTPPREPVEAWLAAAAAEPVLRRVLDRHLPALGDAAQERLEPVVLT